MTPDDAPHEPGRRGNPVAMRIGALIALAGVGPAAVLAWTDRFHGWILLPLVILALTGTAIGYAARDRPR